MWVMTRGSSLGVALGWLCGAYQLAINRPWGSLGWLRGRLCNEIFVSGVCFLFREESWWVSSGSLPTWTGLWSCRRPGLGEIPSGIAIMRIAGETGFTPRELPRSEGSGAFSGCSGGFPGCKTAYSYCSFCFCRRNSAQRFQRAKAAGLGLLAAASGGWTPVARIEKCAWPEKFLIVRLAKSAGIPRFSGYLII
jgi:hypothetical protein